MSLVTFLFIGWVLFFVYRGYQKGLWPMLFGLFGFVASYVVCLLWTNDVAGFLQAFGLQSGIAFIVSISLLFFGTSLLFSLMPKLFMARFLNDRQFKIRAAGAGLGAIVGVVSGLLLVWCVVLIKEAVQSNQEQSIAESAGVSNAETKPGIVTAAASQLVGNLAATGIRLAGADSLQAKTVAVMLREPDTFVTGVKSLSQSAELKQFVNDKHVQYLMATNDVSALQQEQSFRALRNQEGLRALASLVRTQQESGADVDREIAEKMTFVWRRMQYLKADARVQEILNDPEVHQLIQQQNPAKLMMNTKIHTLLSVVLEDHPDMENVDFTQFVGSDSAGLPLPDAVEVRAQPSPPPQIIYKWYDEAGRARYTDLQNTPDDKLEHAQKLSR